MYATAIFAILKYTIWTILSIYNIIVRYREQKELFEQWNMIKMREFYIIFFFILLALRGDSIIIIKLMQLW